MNVVVVSFKMKSPINLFSFILLKFHVANQLKNSTCIAFKKKGLSFGSHCIMTLWRNQKETKEFYNANTELLNNSIKISKEVKMLSFEAYELPNWREALILLKAKGKNYKYQK